MERHDDMKCDTNFQTIRKRIIDSNTNASRNRNLYPIQEQATLLEIWEYVSCECDTNCTCKKFGCTHHWKLKENLRFSDILPAFIRMFVDKRLHERLLDCVNGNSAVPNTISIRAKGALSVLQKIKGKWDELYPEAFNHNKTLICDNWHNSFWKKQWDFSVQGTSIYEAKQFCLLLPDIFIPYDNNSRFEILSFSGHNNSVYFEMLTKLRKCILYVLEFKNEALSILRKLDAPYEQLPFDCNLIFLPKSDFDYGNAYTPKERPLSRIVDKYFYRPSNGDVGKYRMAQPSITID